MLKLAFIGDIAFVGNYDVHINPQAKKHFENIATYLQQFDLVVGNLETPFTSRKRTFTCKAIHLKSHPSNIEMLKYLNIGAVSLANNHILDYGPGPARQTMDLLSRHGIIHFGLHSTSSTVTVNDEEITLHGLCGYSANSPAYGRKSGIEPISEEAVLQLLKSHPRGLNVLSFHWGEENNYLPLPEHRSFARSLSENSDFLLHGHHPHVLQGFEKQNASHIAYSLGNFCFDDVYSIFSRNISVHNTIANNTSLIWEVTIDEGEVKETVFTPIQKQENGDIRLLQGVKKTETLKLIDDISSMLTLDPADYAEIRRQQYNTVPKSRRYTLPWFLDRLNYYFIGAYVKGKINGYNFKKVMQKRG